MTLKRRSNESEITLTQRSNDRQTTLNRPSNPPTTSKRPSNDPQTTLKRPSNDPYTTSKGPSIIPQYITIIWSGAQTRRNQRWPGHCIPCVHPRVQPIRRMIFATFCDYLRWCLLFLLVHLSLSLSFSLSPGVTLVSPFVFFRSKLFEGGWNNADPETIKKTWTFWIRVGKSIGSCLEGLAIDFKLSYCLSDNSCNRLVFVLLFGMFVLWASLAFL